MNPSTSDVEPLTLEVLPERLTVCRLPAGTAVPPWALSAGAFCSVTRTADELSIVCPSAWVPLTHALADAFAHDSGWRALKLVGPFPFTAVGVLLRVAAPLAAAGIGLLPVGTYDTDYVLVREAQLSAARIAVTAAGHLVRDRVPETCTDDATRSAGAI